MCVDLISLSLQKCFCTVYPAACKASSCRDVCVCLCARVCIHAYRKAKGLVLENGTKAGTISSQLIFFAFPFSFASFFLFQLF